MNGRVVPPTHLLSNGEVVEIVTYPVSAAAAAAAALGLEVHSGSDRSGYQTEYAVKSAEGL